MGTTSPVTRRPSVLRYLFHPYVLFFLVALVVWWPEGWNVGVVNDGWIKLGQGLETAWRQPARAVGFFPIWLAMALSRGGFVSWQLTLFALTLLRGALWYEIVRRLFPGRRLFALACGLVAFLHPADQGYFWVESMGVGFAFVLAEACCLAAEIHLETGSRASLAALFIFQLLSCFTYTGFTLIILAFPAGLWLLKRMEGRPASPVYLLKVALPVFAMLAFETFLSLDGIGREGHIMDLSATGVLAGYAYAAKTFFTSSATLFTASRTGYWLLALLPTAFACGLAWLLPAPADAAAQGRRDGRYYAVLVAGLLLLAILAYLPYSISSVRFDNTRQLFAAGIFLYMILLLPLFLALPGHLGGEHLRILLLALVTLAVTVTGLEQRADWTERYRAEERMLAAIARLVPDPPQGAVIAVQLASYAQGRETLEGFYNRWQAFDYALGYMYGDTSLRGAFVDLEAKPFAFGKTDITLRSQLKANEDLSVPYGQLILIGYPGDGSARVLDRDWLRQYAPPGTDLSGYRPGDYGSAPGKDAVICDMLEKALRPAYCN